MGLCLLTEAHLRVRCLPDMKSRSTNLILFIAALFSIIILAEILLRVFGVGAIQGGFYRPHKLLGWEYRPGAEGWQRKEGEQYIRISSQGLRDEEHQLEKPVDTFRIAVLGDSFAAALEVAVADTFWKVAEEQLSFCEPLQGKTVEFVNFGVKGYGTAQQVLQYRDRVRDFSPDFVLLAFLSENDFFNNHPKLNPTNPELAPYFSINEKKELVEPSESSGLTVFWAKAVASLRVAKLIDGGIRRVRGQNRSSRETHLKEELGEDYQTAAIFRRPTHEYMQQAWAVTEALVEQLYREVKADDRRFPLRLLVELYSGSPK